MITTITILAILAWVYVLWVHPEDSFIEIEWLPKTMSDALKIMYGITGVAVILVMSTAFHVIPFFMFLGLVLGIMWNIQEKVESKITELLDMIKGKIAARNEIECSQEE